MPHHHHHGHDHLGNPHDFDAYLAKLEGADRRAWQKPDALVRALKIRKSDLVADVGAGPGYFTRRLAKVARHVWALEADPRMLPILAERTARLRNVAPVLVAPGDPRLPDASIDLAFVMNAYHHFGRGYLGRLARTLRPRGRILNVDFHAHSPLGPTHKVRREDFLRDAARAGLRVVREHTFLPEQYAIELAAR